MGGSFSRNSADIVSEIQNTFIQTSVEECTTNCTNAIVGTTIVINGVDVGGNFEIQQSCNVNQGCTFSNTLQSTINNMITASAQQQNKTTSGILSAFGGPSFSNNQFDYNSYMNNVATQLMQSECRADATNLLANNVLYYGDGTVGGNFVLSQDNNVANQCTMNNLAKIVAMSNQTTAVNQSNVNRNALVMILVAVVIIIVIVVIGAGLIFLLFGGTTLLSGASSAAPAKAGTGEAAAEGAAKGGLASEAAELAPLLLA